MGIQNTVSLRRFCENTKQMLKFQAKDKHWVNKRIVFMRRFFCAPITNVQTDGRENIHNFTLNYFRLSARF